MYTIEILSALPIKEIKQIAAEMSGVKDAVKDARKKTDWIEAIVYAVAGTVPAEVFDQPQIDQPTEINQQPAEIDGQPGHVPVMSGTPAESEQALRQQIDAASEAEQAAIVAGNQPEAERLSTVVSKLLDSYESIIKAQIDALASESMKICDTIAPVQVNPPESVEWVSNRAGTVSIDGGLTYRAFRLLGDWRQQGVCIKLITSTGEISSRWTTTTGNRYIRAIKEDIAKRISKHLAAAQIDLSQWADGFAPQHDRGVLVGYNYQPPG